MNILQYEILPKQVEFMKNVDEVPFATYIGGFGSGKTHVLVLQILREISKGKCLGLVGASTYRLLADTTQRKFFELCPPSWIDVYMKSENRVIMTNGAEILFRSLDTPEKLTNLGLSWFALDEIGEVKLDTFRMLQGRLRDPNGSLKGFSVGNPAGPVHWTYEYFVRKVGDSYRLTQATSYENVFLPKQYTKEMEHSFGKDSTYYKRFVLGMFVALEGAFWPNFSALSYPEGHLIKQTELFDIIKPIHFGKVLDFGVAHPFVCLWYAIDGEKMVFYDEYFASHKTIREHCLQIRKQEDWHRTLYGPHNNDTVYTDHDAVSRVEIENCVDEHGNFIGFDCIPAEKKVMEGILLVYTMFEKGNLLIADSCEEAIRQIASYRAKPPDKTDKEIPIKEDDDAPDCIRMACAMEMEYAPTIFARGGSYKKDLFDHRRAIA